MGMAVYERSMMMLVAVSDAFPVNIRMVMHMMCIGMFMYMKMNYWLMRMLMAMGFPEQ